MDERWETLNLAAMEALETIWDDFANEGSESAVLAPLAQYPSAAARLARSFGGSSEYKTRKIGAMLAGWIDDPAHVSILSEMLANERDIFREDSLVANSVGEDIMFAAIRWLDSKNSEVVRAGIDCLASMIVDALQETPWNTVNWAVANLYRATRANHPVLERLTAMDPARLAGQRFFSNAVVALQRNDQTKIAGMVARPSEFQPLSPENPHYAMISLLWNEAAALEAAG